MSIKITDLTENQVLFTDSSKIIVSKTTADAAALLQSPVVARNFAEFNALCIASGAKSVAVAGEIQITDDYSVPDGVELLFIESGRLVVDAGKILSNVIVCGNPMTQIFSGDGMVSFATQNVIKAIWFGAIGDGVSDNSSAIQKAINAMQATTGGTVLLDTGIFVISSPLSFDGCTRVSMVGCGVYSTTLKCGPTCDHAIDIGVAITTIGLVLRDFGIQSWDWGAWNATHVNNGAIRMGDTTGTIAYAGQTLMHNVRISGFQKSGAYGIWYRNAIETHLLDCHLYQNWFNVYVSDNTMQGTSLTIDGSSSQFDAAYNSLYIDGYIHEICMRDLPLRACKDAAIHVTANGRARIQVENCYLEQNCVNDIYGITSTTTITIGTGSKTLIVQTGLPLTNGDFVGIYNSKDATHMFGAVDTYNSGTGELVVTVATILGSGTFASWTVVKYSSRECVHLIGNNTDSGYASIQLHIYNCIWTGSWSPKAGVDFFGGMYADYVTGGIQQSELFYDNVDATNNAQIHFVSCNRLSNNGADAKLTAQDLPAGCAVDDSNYLGSMFHIGHREFVNGFTVGPHLTSRQDIDSQSFKTITGSVSFGVCSPPVTKAIWRLTQGYDNPVAIIVHWVAGAAESGTSHYTNNSAGLMITSGYSTHDDFGPIIPDPILISSKPRNSSVDPDYLDVQPYAVEVTQVGNRQYIQDVGFTIEAKGDHGGGLVTLNYQITYTGNVTFL